MKIVLRVFVCASMFAASFARASDDQPTFSKGETYDQRTGEAIYRGICQGCHMPDGQGAVGAGAYPKLASNPRLAAAPYPIVVVLGGRRNMPTFAGQLDDAQVAAVVGFVRTRFGNAYAEPVTVAQVAALRAAR